MIIRHGWAASVAVSSEGRRQIFDVLLPGDPVGGALLSYGVVPRTVQALTDVEYCAFDVAFVKQLMEENPEIRQFVMDITYGLLLSMQQRLFDLASRDAEGKILTFILDIYDRLVKIGMAKDGICEFPLRQKSIADAVGLTEVHVNRVMSSLRGSELLWIDKRVLHMPDVESLRRRLG